MSLPHRGARVRQRGFLEGVPQRHRGAPTGVETAGHRCVARPIVCMMPAPLGRCRAARRNGRAAHGPCVSARRTLPLWPPAADPSAIFCDTRRRRIRRQPTAPAKAAGRRRGTSVRGEGSVRETRTRAMCTGLPTAVGPGRVPRHTERSGREGPVAPASRVGPRCVHPIRPLVRRVRRVVIASRISVNTTSSRTA